MVDSPTRYPEATALSNIEDETVATPLTTIFSRVDFPREILSNCGFKFHISSFQKIMRVLWSDVYKGLPPVIQKLMVWYQNSLGIEAYAKDVCYPEREWLRCFAHLFAVYI